MSTQIAQTETAAQVSAIQTQANAIVTSATSAVSNNTFVFFAAFDGTNNIKTNPTYSGDQQPTAVGELSDQVVKADSKNVAVGYFPGVGTPGTAFGSSISPTKQAIATAQNAYDDFAVAAADWLQANPGGSVTTMLTSFSRGSIAAAIFSQMLYENGLVDPNTGTTLIPPGQVGVSAGLVISPVDTGATGNLAFAPNVQNMTVVLADNEYRYLYEQATYNQPGFTNLFVTGNHCDVGSCYDSGIGGLALEAYTGFFNNAGLSIAPVLPSRQFNPDASVVIHAETFDLLNPQNISYGSVAENTPLRTVTIGTPSHVDSTSNGDVTTFVDYAGKTVTVNSIGGITQSVTISPAGEATGTTVNYTDQPSQPVIQTIIGDNATTVNAFDDSGVLLQSTTTLSSGEIDQTDYTNGITTSVTKTLPTASDGSTTANTYDGTGTTLLSSTITAANGSYERTWSRSDGSHGTDAFDSTDGSSSGVSYNGNGTSSAYTRAPTPDGGNVTDVKNYDSNGNLKNETSTTTAPDGSPIISRDLNGDGVRDQVETITTAAAGSIVDDIKNLDSNSNVQSERISTMATDYSQKVEIINTTADGEVDDVKNLDSNGTVQNETVTTTAPDGHSVISRDLNGDGLTDQVETITTTVDGKVDDVKNLDSNSNLQSEMITTDDGQGNIQTDNFNAGGVKISDSWKHQDGSHGADMFNTDGSRSSGITFGTFTYQLSADASYPSIPYFATTSRPILVGGLLYETSVGTLTISWSGTGDQTDFIGDSTSVYDNWPDVSDYRYSYNGESTAHLNWPISVNITSSSVVRSFDVDYIAAQAAAAALAGAHGSSSGISHNSNGTSTIYLVTPTPDGGNVTDVKNFDPSSNLLSETTTTDDGNGNKTFIGGAGNDTYAFNLGDGVDHIQDSSGTNTIAFGAGITPDSISLGLGSLLLHVGPSTSSGQDGDAIHIDDFDPNDVFANPSISNFQFADGTVLSYSDLIAKGFDITGTSGDDTITGTNVNDRINGLSGNDILNGGAGNNTYVFDPGFGHDVVTNPSNQGSIQFTNGILPSDITVSRDGMDLLFTDKSGNQVRVSNWYADANSTPIQQATFANGTVWDAATLNSKAAPVNHAPVATADSALVQEDLITVANGNVLTNDSDADAGTTLVVAAPGTFTGVFGALVLAEDGSYTYTLNNVSSAVQSLSAGQTATDIFSYAASDGITNTAGTVAINITGTNDAPTLINPIANQNATEDAAFGFTVPDSTFADVDTGDALNYAATLADDSVLPAWLTFDAATRTFSGTPGNSDVGQASVKITATDKGNLSVSDTFDLTVTNVNDAPVLTQPLADLTTIERQTFAFVVPANTFSDVDVADALSYTASLANGTPLPSWLAFNSATRTFSGTPGEYDIGTFAIHVAATDQAGAQAADEINLSVTLLPGVTLTGGSGPDTLTGSPGADTISGLAGADKLYGNEGQDLLFGGDGADQLFGWTGNDYLSGGLGNDQLSGEDGNDIAQGGGGADNLLGQAGNDLLDGGISGDTLDGGDGNDFLAAGAGADTIKPGAGQDVIAFNRGDGSDTVNFSTGQDNTLSLGGGIKYSDLALSKTNKNLIVEVGNGEKITLKNWYASTSNHSVLNLQVITDAMASYDPASSDPLLNKRVNDFNFTALVDQFDKARTANTNLVHWSMMNSLLDAHLAGSDSEALGGDLAYQYGKNGTLAGIGLGAAQDVLNSPQFGAQAQTLRPLATLQEGAVKLS